jgi:acyl-CoA thioester hydrolase
MVYSTDIVVRYAETDQMGVVHHAVYPVYFEAARVELMKAVGCPYEVMERMGFFLPVVDLGVKYKQPARFGDVLCVKSEILPVKGIRVRIDYKIFKDDLLLAEGYTLHAFTGKDGRPCRPLGDFVTAIAD